MKLLLLMFVALPLLSAVGCKKQTAATPPPPEVEVVTVEPKDVPIYREWVGTLEGEVNATISAGCAVGPNYKKPRINTPANYRFAPDQSTNSFGDLPWGGSFPGPNPARFDPHCTHEQL